MPWVNDEDAQKIGSYLGVITWLIECDDNTVISNKLRRLIYDLVEIMKDAGILGATKKE